MRKTNIYSLKIKFYDSFYLRIPDAAGLHRILSVAGAWRVVYL